MAMDGAFLELNQLVDAGRKVRGQDSMDIADEDVARAKEIDEMAVALFFDLMGDGHDPSFCPGCQSIHQGRVMLREKLRSQGQEFPMGLLN